jgi:hypothetical protein
MKKQSDIPNIKQLLKAGVLWPVGTLLIPNRFSSYDYPGACGMIINHSVKEGRNHDYIVTSIIVDDKLIQHSWNFIRADFVPV